MVVLRRARDLARARWYPVERQVLALHDLLKTFGPRPRVVVALRARDDHASAVPRAVSPAADDEEVVAAAPDRLRPGRACRVLLEAPLVEDAVVTDLVPQPGA